MLPVRIAMLYAPRPGLETTNLSLDVVMATDRMVAPDMIRLFCDATEPPPNLPDYALQNPPALETAEELERRKAMGGYLWNLNIARALEWAADGEGLVVLLENDIICAANWLVRAMELWREASAAYPRPVILQMCQMDPDMSRYAATPIEASGVKLWGVKVETCQNGNQGVMMDAKTARHLAQRLLEYSRHPDPEFRKHHISDGGIMYACWPIGNPDRVAELLFCDPCLVKHMNAPSIWWPTKDPELGRTKRFIPWQPGEPGHLTMSLPIAKWHELADLAAAKLKEHK